jgi:hypothetical protein
MTIDDALAEIPLQRTGPFADTLVLARLSTGGWAAVHSTAVMLGHWAEHTATFRGNGTTANEAMLDLLARYKRGEEYIPQSLRRVWTPEGDRYG